MSNVIYLFPEALNKDGMGAAEWDEVYDCLVRLEKALKKSNLSDEQFYCVLQAFMAACALHLADAAGVPPTEGYIANILGRAARSACGIAKDACVDAG